MFSGAHFLRGCLTLILFSVYIVSIFYINIRYVQLCCIYTKMTAGTLPNKKSTLKPKIFVDARSVGVLHRTRDGSPPQKGQDRGIS